MSTENPKELSEQRFQRWMERLQLSIQVRLSYYSDIVISLIFVDYAAHIGVQYH